MKTKKRKNKQKRRLRQLLKLSISSISAIYIGGVSNCYGQKTILSDLPVPLTYTFFDTSEYHERNLPSTNPLHALSLSDYITFVDIDNDGDLDLFDNHYLPFSYRHEILYYENTGNSQTPNFVAQASPITSSNTLNLPCFVDIDTDGDLDCFVGGFSYYYGTTTLVYYRNSGTASSPNFIQMPPNNNPLDSLNLHYPSSTVASLSFYDIDLDGDKDFFFIERIFPLSTPKEIVFYENIGTAVTPSFIRNNSKNPFANQMVNVPIIRGKIQFFDWDQDGFLEATIPSNIGSLHFYNSSGSISSPTFAPSPNSPNPLNGFIHTSAGGSIYENNVTSNQKYPIWVDFNGDSELDFWTFSSVDSTWFLYEKIPIFCSTSTPSVGLSLKLFPSPTTNDLNISYQTSIIGKKLSFSILNIQGQVLQRYSMQDVSDQTFRLPVHNLIPGMYILELRRDGQLLKSEQFVKQ